MRHAVRIIRFFLFAFAAVLTGACGGGGGGGAETQSPGSAAVVAPTITKAVAPSNHFVDLTFSVPVSAAANNADSYWIRGRDGLPLAVEDVFLAPDGLSAIVTTDSQQDKTYDLGTSLKSADSAGSAAAVDVVVSFEGDLNYEAYVASAIPLNNTSVLVTFSEKMEKATAETTSFYRILAFDDAQPRNILHDLAIHSATLSEDERTVLLVTDSQDAIEYELEVTNVFLEGSDKDRINPFLNEVSLFGIAPVDTDGPVVTDIISLSSTELLLYFSEPVHASCGDPGNFSVKYCTSAATSCDASLQSEIPVLGASLNSFRTQLTLRTTPQVLGESYWVEIDGCEDAAGNMVADTATASVVFEGSTSSDDASQPPRVLGAVSTGNTSVLVSFSKPMSDSALRRTSYAIGQVSVHPEVGALAIAPDDPAIAFAFGGRTAVEITTLSQNEVLYEVTVVDVTDLSGNTLAPATILVDNSRARFAGTPPSGVGIVDSDGDGLSDNEEQRGWVTTIELTGGNVVVREVTSDPFNADTDGDGLSDKTELGLRTDPRDTDTDDDELPDAYEYNATFSEPLQQDSDGDGLGDGLEVNFFGTSALEADTDGDQLHDDAEVILANRNPRVSDIPQPSIEIGDVDLQLDVRFSETSETGLVEIDSKTRESTLSQTESTAYSNTDEVNNELSEKLAAETTFTIDPKNLGIPEFETTVGFEVGGTHQWNSSWTNSSSEETQRAYTDTLQTEVQVSENETLVREVHAATMSVPVTLRSLGDLAYSISNIQITALISDKRRPGSFRPVATLVPAVEGTEFTLGPLVPARGPIIFINRDVFPAQVESLMSDPRGLIFRISNFNVTDELGRDFAFTSQEIADRTAPLVIDYGGADTDGDGVGDYTERYRIATSFGRPAGAILDSFAGSDSTQRAALAQAYGLDPADIGSPIMFDPTGLATGVDFHTAMQQVLRLTHYDEDTTPSDSLNSTEKAQSYSTQQVDTDGDFVADTEVLYRVRRVANKPPLAGNILEHWAVISSTGVLPGGHLQPRDQILRPDRGLSFAFIKDSDDDGIPARLEYLHGCLDSADDVDPMDGVFDSKDTDGDGIGDHFEVFGMRRDVNGNEIDPDPTDPDYDPLDDREKWLVNIVGSGTYEAFSRCNSIDSDLDGLWDIEEYNGERYKRTDLGDDLDLSSGAPVVLYSFARTDPKEWDTDRDGIGDFEEVIGYELVLRLPLIPDSVPPHYCRQPDPANDMAFPGEDWDLVICHTDPANPDTDGDTLKDGDELVLGSDPSRNDGADVIDIDGDSLLGREEATGWDVIFEKLSTTPGVPGATGSCTFDVGSAVFMEGASGDCQGEPPTSDAALVDTDVDGLRDDEERDLGTHARVDDTDDDGRSDFDEVMGCAPLDPDCEHTDPKDADSDNDTLSDHSEIEDAWNVTVLGQAPYPVRSSPNAADVDSDMLLDGDEKMRLTDPDKFNTDGDTNGLGDGAEVTLGLNPLDPDDMCVRVTFVRTELRCGVTSDCDGPTGGGDDGGWITGRVNISQLNETQSPTGRKLFINIDGDNFFDVGENWTSTTQVISQDFLIKKDWSVQPWTENVTYSDTGPGIAPADLPDYGISDAATRITHAQLKSGSAVLRQLEHKQDNIHVVNHVSAKALASADIDPAVPATYCQGQ